MCSPPTDQVVQMQPRVSNKQRDAIWNGKGFWLSSHRSGQSLTLQSLGLNRSEQKMVHAECVCACAKSCARRKSRKAGTWRNLLVAHKRIMKWPRATAPVISDGLPPVFCAALTVVLSEPASAHVNGSILLALAQMV